MPKMRLLIPLAWVMVATAVVAEPQQKEEVLPDQAAILMLSCATCHGINGRGSATFPPITNYAASYMEEMMQDFRTEQRSFAIMRSIAQGYSDAEIRALALYIETLSY